MEEPLIKLDYCSIKPPKTRVSTWSLLALLSTPISIGDFAFLCFLALSSWANEAQPGDDAEDYLVLAILFASVGGGLVCAIVGLVRTLRHPEKYSPIAAFLGVLATVGLFLVLICFFSGMLRVSFR